MPTLAKKPRQNKSSQAQIINKPRLNENRPDLILSELLKPMDDAYTDAAAFERMRRLGMLYGYANGDDQFANILAEMTRRSYWAYLALAVWTKDPKSLKAAVKPFSPIRVYRDLSDWADAKRPDGTWLRPVLVVDKSRQLMLSWWCVLRLNWLGQMRPFAEMPVVSKREQDAVRVLDRIPVVHRYYPAWYRKMMGLETMRGDSFTRSRINYSNGAYIEALPEDGEKVRSMVVSGGWLCDEAAFQPHFADNYGSIRGGSPDPRVQGMVVSTPAVSEFEALIHDTQDGRRGGKIIERPRTMEATYEGERIPDYEFWLNRLNNVHCASITFLADPARRSPEWWSETKRGVPMHKLKQEHLLCYTARGGQPVFPMLTRDAHMIRGRIEISRRGNEQVMSIGGIVDPTSKDGALIKRPVSLILSVDFGIRRFAATWHAITLDEYRDWYVYRTYVGLNKTWDANARSIAEMSEGETYHLMFGDCMQRLIDGPGQIIDLINRYRHTDDTQPFRRMCKPLKGAHSRRDGVDAIQGMMLSALAINAPDHSYWDDAGYSLDHRESFTRRSGIYIGPQCEDLFTELDQARYDERPGGDPMMDAPDTTLDMQDDLIDTVRYGILGAGHLITSSGAAA